MLYAFITILLATLAAGDCAADNCLRAFRATKTPGRLEVAQSFCATFTRQIIPATAIPTFAVDACKEDQNGPLTLRISSACSCISTATVTASPTTSPVVTTGACAIVSSSAAAQRAISPAATPTVAAQLAYECLNSVPLVKEAALALVDSMVPYIEWQSDIAFKKNPPSDYFYPPHDIFGYLAKVKSNLQQNFYANEYQFEADLYQVFARSHDGHFVFYPDGLTKAIEFGHGKSLVSISKDGAELPQIKLYDDVLAAPATAPVIVEINGINAAKYVADFAFTATFNQDPDAAYNSMFFEKAFVAAGVSNGYFASGGRIRYIYPGPNTTLTFDTGKTVTFENVGRVKGNFAGVTDGKSFYQQFCTGPQGVGISQIMNEPDSAVVPGYPEPIVATNDNIVSGYYLNGTGFEDVAVLSVLAFENESPLEFQQVAEKLLASAVRDGKKKLVIDLSANGGGYILQGYDLFRQLFPDIIQDGYTRFRESDTLLSMAQVARDSLPADFDPQTASADLIDAYESFLNYRYDYNLTNQPFKSFEAKFAPQIVRGDPYTSIIRWNLDDSLTTSNDTFGLGIDITGYGSRKNFTQPFKAENIIMLTDGFCASTCTLFSEFMRIQAGVKVIAMGGRPQPGQIQAIGGIKGAQILQWSSILQYAQTALKTATQAQAKILRKLTPLPIMRSSNCASNVRDNILPNNLNDGLPAQFVYEPADCRLFYTAPMIKDVTQIWKAAADVAFNGGACAAGGLPKRDVMTEVGGREVDDRVLERSFAKAQRGAERQTDDMWTARHGRKVIS